MMTCCLRRATTLAVVTGALALAGCGGDDTATVTGRVTYKGRPLNCGEVCFVAAGKDGKSRSAPIGADGTYTVTDAPTGKVRASVVVRAGQPAGAAAQPKHKDAPPLPGSQVQPVTVPAKYASPAQSGLVYTLAPGSQTIHVDLKN
jgi:hypothetical protein